MRVLTIPLTTFFLALGFQSHSQCSDCPGDFNYDYFIGGSDMVGLFSQDWCTTETDPCTDINEDGVLDAKDILAFMQHKGQNCFPNEELLPTDPSFSGVFLVDMGPYPECDFPINSNDIPFNTHIYRLYALIEDEEEILTGVYGTSSLPIEINSSTYFITLDDPNNLFADFNGQIFFELWPCYTHRTYLAFGYDEMSDTGPNVAFTDGNLCGGQDAFSVMQAGGNLNNEGSDLVWCRDTYSFLPEYQGEWRLIAQLVTDGEINGVLNLAVADGLDRHELVCFEGLTFGMDNLLVAGCMDEAAMNFDPNADFPTPCFYPGDVNADGDIDLEDLINFLNDFGCNADCGFADMNGDGVVNAADLILLLQFLNCC